MAALRLDKRYWQSVEVGHVGLVKADLAAFTRSLSRYHLLLYWGHSPNLFLSTDPLAQGRAITRTYTRTLHCFRNADKICLYGPHSPEVLLNPPLGRWATIGKQVELLRAPQAKNHGLSNRLCGDSTTLQGKPLSMITEVAQSVAARFFCLLTLMMSNRWDMGLEGF